MSKLEAIHAFSPALVEKVTFAEVGEMAQQASVSVDTFFTRAEGVLPVFPDFLQIEELFMEDRLGAEGFVTYGRGFFSRLKNPVKHGEEPVDVVAVKAYNGFSPWMADAFATSLQANPMFVDQLPEEPLLRAGVLSYAREIYDRKTWRMILQASYKNQIGVREKQGYYPMPVWIPGDYGDSVGVSWEEIAQRALFETEVCPRGLAKTFDTYSADPDAAVPSDVKRQALLFLGQGKLALGVSEYILGEVKAGSIRLDPHFVDVPPLPPQATSAQETVTFRFPDGAKFPIQKARGS